MLRHVFSPCCMLLRVVGSCSTVSIPLQQGRNIVGAAAMLEVVFPGSETRLGIFWGIFFGLGIFFGGGGRGGVVGSLKDFVGFSLFKSRYSFNSALSTGVLKKAWMTMDVHTMKTGCSECTCH